MYVRKITNHRRNRISTNDYLAAIEILEKRALKAEEELEAVTAENQTLKEHKDIMALALCNMQRDINLLKGGE